MRNLKKILALVLALVMSLSVMATANAFSDSDKIDGTFNEAVEVLSALGVFQGYEDGSFAPKGSITRAEVAAIIYRIVTGDVNDKQVGIYADYNKFDDVKSTSWYAGYVNFCANAEYIKGYDAKTFGPNDPVTGYQALAMILRAVGYDKNGEFTGAGWQVQTAAVGKKLGITDNISAGTLGTAATREVVAEILFQTIAYVKQVDYTVAFGYTSIGNNTIGWDTFKLVPVGDTHDVWGRPGFQWNAYGTALCVVAEAPIFSAYVATSECDIATAYGLKGNSEYAFTTYTNGVKNVSTTYINPIDVATKIGAQGQLIEVYEDEIVLIDTLLAKVNSVAAARYDAASHRITPASITLTIWDTASTVIPTDTYKPTTTTTYTVATETSNTNYAYVAGDMVLVNAVQYATGRVCTNADQHVEIVKKADALVGAQTVIWYNAKQHTVNGAVYNDNNRFHLDQAGIETTNHTWYFDTQGNLIGATNIANSYTYGVVTGLYWANNAGVGTNYANITYMDGTTADVKLASIDLWNADKKTYWEDCVPVYALSGSALAVTTDARGVNYVGVSTWAYDNAAALCADLYRITTLADGSLKLDAVDELAAATIKTGVSAVKGTTSKVATPAGKTIYTNSNTQYLVYNPVTGALTTVTGFNNIASYTKTTAVVDYVDVNGDTYVDYAFVIGTPDYSTASKLVYITGNQLAIYVDNNKVTHYVVTAANINGEATTVDTTDYALAINLINNVNDLFIVEYAAGYAATATEVVNTFSAGGHDVAAICGAGKIVVRMNGALLNGNVLSTLSGSTRLNVTNSTTYVGELAAINYNYVYVVVNMATTQVDAVYVSPKAIATAGAKTVTLTESDAHVSVLSNETIYVAAGAKVTNVALLNTNNWAKQGVDTYTVTVTDAQNNTWVVENVKTTDKVMTFDITAPAGLVDTTLTLTWAAK